MNPFRWITGLVVALLGSTAVQAQIPPPRFEDPARLTKLRTAFPEVDRMFTEFARDGHVPGIAYGVIVDGRLEHVGVWGVRDVPAKSPVEAGTVFRIASMTKSFTALSILKLRDEGKLGLDDLAEKYVPEIKNLRYPTGDSPRLTIRHLLSHAEGFPEDNPWGDRQLAATDEQMSAMIRRGVPFSKNAPGIAYEYSNFGFAILGRIVQVVSGMPYADYVRANLLQPLQMTATTLEPSAVPPDKAAHGYRWEDGAWRHEPSLPHGAFGAMGGMLTSIRDLGKYVGFLMSAWPPRDDRDDGPVRRASLREMQQGWRSIPATVARTSNGALDLNASAYGFGLRIRQSCDFPAIVSHGGGLPGFGSQMRWLPEYGVGMIALGNLTYTGWAGVFDRAFEALRKTGGLEPRMIQPSAALVQAKESVSRLITRWDGRLADEIAADNLYLDQSKDRRRKAIEDLTSRLGSCSPEPKFVDVENALRGQWEMRCERGNLRVSITLAPTSPPRVQFLSVQPAPDTPRFAAACRP